MVQPYAAPTLGSTITAGSGDITLVEPSGSTSGDLFIAEIAFRGSAAFTLPAGWSLVSQQSSGNTVINGTGSIASGLMCYIVRGASAPALTWTRTGGDVAHGRIRRYPGPWPASPLDVSSANTESAASTTVTASGLTTTKDGALLVGMIAGARSGSASAFASTTPRGPSNTSTTDVPDSAIWTERHDQGTTTGADVSLSAFDAVKDTAGATGNFSADHSQSAQHVMIVAAFKNDGVDLTEERVSKLTGYAVIDTLVKDMEVSKLTGYAVLEPLTTEIRVSKLTAYVVLKPGAPSANKRRSQNVNFF